jgi:uncharacterized protein
MINKLKKHLIEQTANVVSLSLRVTPKSSRTEIVDQLEDGSWKIRVAAVPEKGRANREIIKFLKKALNVFKVEIIIGKQERLKVVRITIKNPVKL